MNEKEEENIHSFCDFKLLNLLPSFFLHLFFKVFFNNKNLLFYSLLHSSVFFCDFRKHSARFFSLLTPSKVFSSIRIFFVSMLRFFHFFAFVFVSFETLVCRRNFLARVLRFPSTFGKTKIILSYI